jgi:phosphatidylglycerol lysyltransferase
MNQKTRQILTFCIVLFLVVLTGVFIDRFLDKYSLHTILHDLNAIPVKNKLYAVLLTAVSYLFLTSYDFLGLRYLGRKLATGRVLLASFLSYGFSNSIGLSVLASGSLRYRYYSSWGLSFSEISRMVIFTSATLWLGILAAGGAAFTLTPVPEMPLKLHMFINIRIIGALFLIAVSAYYFMLVFFRRPFSLFGQEMVLPSPFTGMMQIAVGALDWVLAGAVLYVLMPDQVPVGFGQFIGIFILAQTIGLISHVPGGAVVFETVLLSFFPADAVPSMIGTLLVYRVTYYILPLMTAALILGITEGARQKQRMLSYAAYLSKTYRAVIPNLISVIVFIVGAYMLFAGATPINPDRFAFVKRVFPLAVVETSHFLASITGMGLIILSGGLRKRIDLAFQLTLGLLAAGTVFALLKGAEIETALFAIAIAAAMLPARKLFSRRSPFFDEVFTTQWAAAVFAILVVYVWLGFFSYKHVEYRSSLWWTFTFSDQAPRFLRTLVGVFSFMSALLLYKFMQPSKKVQNESELTPEQTENIVKNSPDTSSYLAYLPDKRFLTNGDKSSFIMYGIDGRCFVSMGDPVSPQDEDDAAELIISFRKLAKNHGCSAVFYEVSTDYIPQYIDAGFRIYKIGEEARVPLSGFTLEGSHWSGTRNNLKKMEKENCRFEIIEDTQSVLPELKRISDEWLEGKNTREKQFSLGCFNDDYIRKTPVAVVYKDDAIVAFANLWAGADKDELSIDLMRYGSAAPKGVMEYLFVKLILFGKESGFGYFNLGMAPLSGIDTHSFSPLWNRVASGIFNHGERFYNFKGLRSYKDKFNPQWKPKYIAVQSFFDLPSALKSIAALISGGTSGIFGK